MNRKRRKKELLKLLLIKINRLINKYYINKLILKFISNKQNYIDNLIHNFKINKSINNFKINK